MTEQRIKIIREPNRIVNICGIRYAEDLFESLAGGMELNIPFVITKREDGVLYIKTYEADDEK